MNAIDGARLTSLTTSALETVAFVAVDIGTSDQPHEFARHGEIQFHGQGAHGRLSLSASDGFLAELASSMLGVEPEEVDALRDGQAALLELLNIVAGEVIVELGGQEEAIKLGMPASTAAPMTGEIEVLLNSMGEPLRVALALDTAAAS